MSLKLGAVADDFTGATDLASMLVRGGMKTVLQLGVPEPGAPLPVTDAVVVALKSRTAPVAEAIADSLTCWRWMANGGARRCYFKYCSTFDSTPAGNIGPVAEALLSENGGRQTVYTPAFPENGRTIYQGKLFVGSRLLSESGMRYHPLTPMTDADLPRVLAAQLSDNAAVGLVPWERVREGAGAIAQALVELAGQGICHVVVDALVQADLDALAEAVADFPLVTAGSGLGLSLGRVLAGAGGGHADTLPPIGGPTVLLSGSCSEATNRQVARWEAEGGRLVRLDPETIAARGPEAVVEGIAGDLAADRLLVAGTAPPERVKAAQERLGRAEAARLIEETLAAVARSALAQGIRRYVVAGGETAGAVADALGATRLAVGPSIAPGVPWCATLDEAPIALALKSGNFGGERFFTDALETAP